jgi:hypothetical protein
VNEPCPWESAPAANRHSPIVNRKSDNRQARQVRQGSTPPIFNPQSEICNASAWPNPVAGSGFSPDTQQIGKCPSPTPVVGKGLARIRVQLSAGHETEHIDKAIAAFVKVGKKYDILNKTKDEIIAKYGL